MASRDPITSAFAPDIEEVRAWLQKMIAALRFVDLVTAILALIMRMRDLNTELVAQLAHLRRARPRSETLERIERQLVLQFDGVTVPSAAKPNTDTPSDDDKKRRRGRHPGRGASPGHLQRVPVFNRVPPEQRICPQCGSLMTTVSHSSCFILNVIPARVFVEERLDETIACRNDDTIVSASSPPQIVERGKLGDTLIVEAVCRSACALRSHAPRADPSPGPARDRCDRALVGTNGSGKSTFRRLLLALAPPQAGAIVVGGDWLNEVDPDSWRATLAFLPQRPYLPPRSNIRAAVHFPVPRAPDERIRQAVHRVGMLVPLTRANADPLAVSLDALSVGERQRVALARLLCQDASLVLMDEPDANSIALASLWSRVWSASSPTIGWWPSLRIPPSCSTS